METGQQNSPIPEVIPAEKTKNSKISLNLLVIVMVVSLVFGGIGGAAGAFYLLRVPLGQKLFANLSGPAAGQQMIGNENSEIIDVVKKDSPAVVSIIVSQDLNKLPGYGATPFSQDPFFNFFYNNGSSGQSQTAPSQPNVQEVAAGSGFFVSPDGLIVTNKHVVSQADASYTVITSDGKTYDAKVAAQDPVNDLAVVKVSIKNAPYLSFADSAQIQIGQAVVAIGNSLGQYQNTVTSGIISGTSRSITAGGETGSEDLSGVIQTDAAINPGNSGGPLLDLLGQVIGINTAIDQQGQLVGFAIPSNEISKALTSYQKNGKIIRPFLGVRYLPITQSLADQQKLPYSYGALIVRGSSVTDFAVQPGSPADKAGLVENDIILEVNGQKVDGSNTLSTLLQNYNAGDTVNLKVYDKGQEKTVKVTLGENK